MKATFSGVFVRPLVPSPMRLRGMSPRFKCGGVAMAQRNLTVRHVRRRVLGTRLRARGSCPNSAGRAIGLRSSEVPAPGDLGNLSASAAEPGYGLPEAERATVQALPPTERRWNRTVQAEGCSALPVLKTGAITDSPCLSQSHWPLRVSP